MDKITNVRQEIERRQKKYQHSHDASNTTFPIYLELDNLLSFLDTLEEEPVCPDDGGAPSKQKCGDCTIACEAKVEEEPDKSLEEEVKNYFRGYWPGTETAEQCNTDLHFTPLAILRLAHHFAEWQKERDQRLITLAKDSWYKEGFIYGQFEGITEDEKYQQGQFDMKEQMMKDALHGWLDEDNTPPYDLNLVCREKIPYGEFSHNDKVKIIVIKED